MTRVFHAITWLAGLLAGSAGLSGEPAAPAAAASAGGFKKLPTAAWSAVIPVDKGLPPGWRQSLLGRGEPRTYQGEALMNIGMPVGGVCAGFVYLGGDGKLWWWDIFNRQLNGVQPRQIQYKGRSWHGMPVGLGAWQGGNYVDPVKDQPSPFEQGFAVRVTANGKTQQRTLDRKGWKQVVFRGTYPIGTVEYSDPDCPVKVTLEAYTPYCPLDFDNSSYPAVLLNYHFENTGGGEVNVDVGGWLENAVMIDNGRNTPGLLRSNTITSEPGLTMLTCAAKVRADDPAARPDVLFDDFERGSYRNWKAAGTAFGAGPVAADACPRYMGDVAVQGSRAANSHAAAPIEESAKANDGDASAARDRAKGMLTSREFTIERNYLTFLIGGGNLPTCGLRLLVDGEVVRSASGHNGNAMRAAHFDVKSLAGRTAHLQIVDGADGPWGNIGVDHIVFRDVLESKPVTGHADWGTMVLAAIGGNDHTGTAKLTGTPAEGLFGADDAATATLPPGQQLLGGVTQSLALPAGGRGTAKFALAWHFVNVKEGVKGGSTGWYYGKRFGDAAAVARHVAANEQRLSGVTRRWRDTWYDSTLPVWFLDRIFIPLDCLASTTCYRFADGRFYTYEGVRSCAGHPDHVWHYAQGHARIFPELEQDVLERTWYGMAYHDDGSHGHRGDVGPAVAIDGHCGVILAVLRAHQMNPDDAMLRRMWPRVKKSVEYAMSRDRDGDGLLDTPMLTTLDEPWYGQIPWVSSMYLAALQAGGQMAAEMGDAAFAETCRHSAAKGRAAMDAELFNGEWFVQTADPAHPDKLGAYETCHIDQVLGQGWAWQVGLGRVVNEDTTRSALRSLWKYNFARDLTAYDRQAAPKGRPYFVDGEGGLVMTANALGRDVPFGVHSGFACYLNETMNGFEYQAAAHMIAEGLVDEGMTVIRTLDERYDGNKRNPYDEVECGDHYARSMASYGALIAISGYEYHGPMKHIGFAPRLNPGRFKAPFTAAQGWGSFEQSERHGIREAKISLGYGKLRLKSLSLGMDGRVPKRASVRLGATVVDHTLETGDGKVRLAFRQEIETTPGNALVVILE